MSFTRRSGSFGAVSALLTLVMLLTAVVLVGCGGTKESPGGPSGTGASKSAETLAVPESVRAEMFDVMKAAGLAVGDPMYVYMTYASDAKDTIDVTGSFKGPQGLKAGAPVVSFSSAKLKNVNGKWAVAEAK